MTVIDELLKVSHFVGQKSPIWSQGTGGNISVKDGDSLFIKASGTRLDQMSTTRGIIEVDHPKLVASLEMLRENEASAQSLYAALLTPKSGSSYNNGKPSMEAGMHAILPKKWVFHFHSLVGLVLVYEYHKTKDKVAQWMGEQIEGRFHFVSAISPGWCLANWIHDHPLADYYILENHGVLLQGEDEAVLNQWSGLEEKFITSFGYKGLHGTFQNSPTPLKLYFPDSAVFLDRLKSVLSSAGGTQEKPLYRLNDNATRHDPDAADIWQATEILFRACPQLPDLPSTLSDTIPHLPTETYRKSIK